MVASSVRCVIAVARRLRCGHPMPKAMAVSSASWLTLYRRASPTGPSFTRSTSSSGRSTDPGNESRRSCSVRRVVRKPCLEPGFLAGRLQAEERRGYGGKRDSDDRRLDDRPDECREDESTVDRMADQCVHARLEQP